jgi:hypothetical protein
VKLGTLYLAIKLQMSIIHPSGDYLCSDINQSMPEQ